MQPKNWTVSINISPKLHAVPCTHLWKINPPPLVITKCTLKITPTWSTAVMLIKNQAHLEHCCYVNQESALCKRRDWQMKADINCCYCISKDITKSSIYRARPTACEVGVFLKGLSKVHPPPFWLQQPQHVYKYPYKIGMVIYLANGSEFADSAFEHSR